MTVVDEPTGSGNHPDNPRDHDLAVMVGVDHANEITITVVFGTARLDDELIDALVAQLESRVESMVETTGAFSR
ncbi:MAG: hypothetical protein ACI8Y4_002664 [Candidatus Poriferisodalaceae bacterium]